MTSYLPSVKLPSLSSLTSRSIGGSSTTERPTDAPLHELPDYEAKPLSDLHQRSLAVLSADAHALPDGDPWKALTEATKASELDEILLRFLRYNNLNVDKACKQFKSTVDWRAKTAIATLDSAVMRGMKVGLPVGQVSDVLECGDALFFAPAEAYVRRVVDHGCQQSGVAKMFDYLLYDGKGPCIRRASVVVDCTNLSVKNVDIVGLRAGVMTYLNYFPDVFHQILLINYPKFMYGVWKAIAPLLDARTVSRVMWVTSGDAMREHLLGTFGSECIPVWMGGTGREDGITLYNDFVVHPSEMVPRFA